MTLALFGGPATLAEPHQFHWPRISPSQKAAVAGLLDADEISYYGTEGAVAELEAMWSRRLDGRRALATSSGTAALHSAFFALGAQPGDEVICPTHTFLATAMPLVQLGATPVLADAERDTATIDPASIEAAITPRTVGIVVTHLWGHPCAMAEIQQIAERHSLWVVEDCSHAHGARYHDAEVGTLGDAAAFSLQAAKAVYAGQGGLLISRDTQTHERACLHGHFRVRSEQDVHSELRRYASTGFGLNYRMHPLGAALAVQTTRELDDLIERRTRLLNTLTVLLSDVPGLTLPVTRPGMTRGAFYGYKVLLEDEWRQVPTDLLVQALAAEGLDVHRPGSTPLHRLPFFTDEKVPLWLSEHECVHRRTYRQGDFPVAEELAQWSLSLPTFSFDDEAPLVAGYAEAFRKVHAALPDLRGAGRS